MEIFPPNYLSQFKILPFILGGAGGKGTWGKIGCELELAWVDPNDPNYESDSEANGAGTKACYTTTIKIPNELPIKFNWFDCSFRTPRSRRSFLKWAKRT